MHRAICIFVRQSLPNACIVFVSDDLHRLGLGTSECETEITISSDNKMHNPPKSTIVLRAASCYLSSLLSITFWLLNLPGTCISFPFIIVIHSNVWKSGHACTL
ncbi:hypothetical protein SDJN03_14947, partial [Cucurbita argyrosperma subsp. sororia]